MKTNSKATADVQEFSRQSILSEITKLVSEFMDIPPESIGENDDLENDIGCDSLDLSEIVMEVEEHFDINVPDDVYQDARTTGSIADRVFEFMAEKADG